LGGNQRNARKSRSGVPRDAGRARPFRGVHEYLDRHRPVLSAYWQNYVLDPESPHAEPIIATALRADRSDLKRLLEDVDVVAVAEDALRRATEMLEADCPVDLYVMVGVGAANAGELVIGGRGIAFVCLEHFTGGRTRRPTAWDSRPSCYRCGSRTRLPTRCAIPRRRAARRCGASSASWVLLRRMGNGLARDVA